MKEATLDEPPQPQEALALNETNQVEEDNKLFKNKNFNWLWIGGAASFLGDNATLIAFPWLVLTMTTESWVLGAVLALMGLPRAIFIFVGGAIVDRFSSKSVLLYSKYANAVLLLSLAGLIYLEQLTINLLYLYAFLIGVGSAFALPAGSSILPSVVQRQQLEQANGVFFILHKVTMFLGPVLAGILLGSSEAPAELMSEITKQETLHALSILLALDGATFVLSAITLLQVTCKEKEKANTNHNLLKSIVMGFSYFWNLPQLRAVIVYIAIVNAIVGGLILVGLPILVKQQLNAGGDIFGYLMGANGLGTVLGLILAGKKPQIGTLSLGVTFLFADLVLGILLAALYGVTSHQAAYTLLFAAGILAGYIHLAVYTWVQKQPRPDMLGRVMAIMMFTAMGIPPLASALYGFVLNHAGIDLVFLASGFILIAVALVGLTSPQLKTVERD
ncbi:MAG: MFS transporter [Cellvibrionaceae bacterium]